MMRWCFARGEGDIEESHGFAEVFLLVFFFSFVEVVASEVEEGFQLFWFGVGDSGWEWFWSCTFGS